MKNYDVAVIGGGLAGLIAAIDLAEGGRSVAVLEKSDRMGGRAITVNKNGALFNLGGHALYRGGETYQILQSFGLRLSGKKPSVKGLALWDDKVMLMPGDAAGMLRSALLSWSGKMELMGLMLKIYKTHAEQLPLMSLRDWAEKEIRDPMVRHAFYSLCRTSTYVHDPDYQSAGPVLLQVQRALKSGVLYLDGGWQMIVEQLREKAIRMGVDLLANKHVVEIQHEAGSVRRLRFADNSTLNISHVREVLQYEYDEIAEIVDKSSSNCRQIFHRAKRAVCGLSGMSDTAPPESASFNALIEQFIQAVASGNTGQLMSILKADVSMYSDGGGKVTAAVRPILGADRVIAFLMGIASKFPADMSFRLHVINGQPGIVNYIGEQASSVVTFRIEDDRSPKSIRWLIRIS